MELREAVAQLQRELEEYPADLRDRGVAEEALGKLDAAAREREPSVPKLQRSLLLIAATVGSVSALTAGLHALRAAVDRFSAPGG
ncbi:hypothetical protein E0L36_14850 [Streptomyces sp. AJS327]|nr:hypothetical protein [Streptomyces sp. AJS327]